MVVSKIATVLCVAALSCAAAVERMDVPKAGARSAASCGVAIGPTRSWDFTKGSLPAGTKLRPAATLSERGVGCAGFERGDAKGGVQIVDASTPEGAFLFEAEIEVGNYAATSKVEHVGRVWDDMGINYRPKRDNTGLEIGLRQRTDGYWTPQVRLGMGDDTYLVEGESLRLYGGARTKFAVFFGANGRVVMEFGGLVTEKTIPATGGIAKSKRYKPVIGSRPESLYANLDGFVRRVSLTPMKRDAVVLRVPGREAFLRGEKGARYKVVVENRADGAVSGATAKVEQFCAEGRAASWRTDLGTIAAGGVADMEFGIETRVKPGWHALRVTLSGKGADGADFEYVRLLRYGIGPQLGDRLPVTLWGYAAAAPASDLTEMGFTHGYVYMGGPNMEGPFDAKPVMNMFDRAAVAGLSVFRINNPDLFPPGEDVKKYVRWDCLHRPMLKKPAHERPEVSNPVLQERFRRQCARDADIFADHPAFVGVLCYSERRDRSCPSFNTEPQRYKEDTGRDIPKGVDARTYRLPQAEKRFPDGVIPDDDEIWGYYSWFLKGGDGWPKFHTAGFDEYRKRITGRRFTSFWDPAVRWAPAWGAGGSADMINQWCYAVPEPMNVAGPAEEMFAMAAGRPGQKVSMMTQLICYRSQMSPTNEVPEPMPAWAVKFPKLKFPTIPPDVLQEATWSMISKPVKSIMYHGWATIHDLHGDSYYGMTNPESADRMRHLLKDVVAPLGPTLMRLGRDASQVAVFESLATCAMGGPASWGWKAPSITFMQRARLDPRVVYEQTIERDGFDGIKILYAPQCRFMTKSMIEKLKSFQASGGVLVGDKEMLSALKPDVKVPVVSFDAPPESDYTEDVDAMEGAKAAHLKTRRATIRAKTFMHEAAANIRKALAAKGYHPLSDSSSAEIVVYNRRWKNVPYLFAVNDKRTFGDYVGPWGRVMERGLPEKGWVSLRDPDGKVGAVYELSRGGRVAFSRADETVKVPVEFETNDGRMFAFLPAAIGAVAVDAPDSVARGGEVSVTMTVKDARGAAVPALLPVEVRLYDASGREIDGGGFACAEGGVAKVRFATNLDDPAGPYRLVCKDRASGLMSERRIR